MKRVIGIGGIFFKSKNPKRLIAWYRKHLGMEPAWEGGVVFDWEDVKRPGRRGQTVWSPFPTNTDYFRPGREPYMINYIVDNLDSLLGKLRRERVKVLSKIEESDFGRFAWIRDPEGRRLELWEPPVQGAKRKKKRRTGGKL